jgi:prolyl-tRNA editing enzyme YbaK/EbsC (Cys-tRNA(Pro) deacylase)
MPTEHASITSFRGDLARRGGTGDVVILPDSAHTAALAAAALGCEVGAIANSLLFDGDGEPVLILTSGAHRVDTRAVAERIGVGRLKRADPEFVRRHTGQVIGGVSPIDHPAPVPTCGGVLHDLRRAGRNDRCRRGRGGLRRAPPWTHWR